MLTCARLTEPLRGLVAAAVAFVACTASAGEQLIREVTDLDFAFDRTRGELVFDLYGALWRMPVRGGIARPLASFGSALNRPAVSPDGRWLAAEFCPGVDCVVRLFDRETATSRDIMPGPWSSMMPAFSADSRRLAFASTRDGTYDIWMQPLDGGEPQRMSFGTGDEIWPAYAEHADALAWVASTPEGHRLMRLTGGGHAEALYRSAERIEAPSFRPDGSVIVFFEGARPRRLRMLIDDGSEVVKTLQENAELQPQPAVWTDRDSALVSAGGQPARLLFGEAGLTPVPLQAFVSVPEQPATRAAVSAATAAANHGRYVLRVGHTLDTVSGTLRGPTDIVIVDDRIESIGPPKVHGGDVVVFDSPSLTALPGLIALRLGSADAEAPVWLRHGFTRVICVHSACDGIGQKLVTVEMTDADSARISHVHEARADGFGVVSSRLYPDVAAGATAWLARRVPTYIYEDYARLLQTRRAAVVLPLEGAVTEAIDRARAMTDRVLFASGAGPERFVARLIELANADVALHGSAAGTLRALTVDAALAAGIGADAGRLAPGRVANLILVDGDPLTNPSAVFTPAAIVEGGRYLTPAGLFASDNSN